MHRVCYPSHSHSVCTAFAHPLEEKKPKGVAKIFWSDSMVQVAEEEVPTKNDPEVPETADTDVTPDERFAWGGG